MKESKRLKGEEKEGQEVSRREGRREREAGI